MLARSARFFTLRYFLPWSNTQSQMKLALLSLGLAGFLLTSTLAGDAGSEKICVKNPDPGICTLAVVSDHVADGVGGEVTFTYVQAFDNECWSIVESDECMDNKCILNRSKEILPFILNLEGNENVVEIDAREQGDIFKHPPLFSYKFGDEEGDDYKETERPCTCAHDKTMSGRTDSTV